MAGKLALVDYNTCDPTRCAEGVCPAVVACPRKLLIQEAPFDAPMSNPSPCRGCGDCARSCPHGAIKMTTG